MPNSEVAESWQGLVDTDLTCLPPYCNTPRPTRPPSGLRSAAAPPPPRAAAPRAKTVWWHQIDDENDENYEVRDVSEWHASVDLRKARLHLVNNRGPEGVASLEKLRADLLLYARDAG